MMKLNNDQKKRVEKDNKDRRSSDQDYKDLDLDSNRDIIVSKNENMHTKLKIF